MNTSENTTVRARKDTIETAQSLKQEGKLFEGGFILSKILKTKLKELSSSANPDGEKIVRWTDLLERGVAKLTLEDLLELRAMRLTHLKDVKRENV